MALRRTLGTRDITLFAIACIVGTRWIATAAHAGPGSIVLWALALLLGIVEDGKQIQRGIGTGGHADRDTGVDCAAGWHHECVDLRAEADDRDDCVCRIGVDSLPAAS